MRYLFSTGELPHIFHDPVDVHTRRCVWTVDTLALPSWVDVDRIRRTLWIHDIPEIIANEEIGNDVTAPDKANNPELSLQIDKQEDQIAKRDLNSDDYKLYEDFERASNFTKS